MTGGRLSSVILKLAIPNTVGLLVIAAYSLADSFFVASLGTDASAAVGVTFSLHVLVQAVGYTLGMGAGSLISRALGRRERERASQYATPAFWLALLLGALITVLGLCFSEPWLRFLGASGSVLPYAKAYLRPFLWSAPAMCGVFVLSQLLRSEGKALYSMTGLLVGSLLNIALDPLFITALGMGIAGASVATLISQYVSLAVLLSAYWRRKSAVSLLAFKKTRLPSTVGRICVAGLPSLFRQGLSGISAILLNHAAARVGDAAVAGMSLVARIFLLVFSFCLGIGQGMMPVVGYCRGAGEAARIRRAYRFSVLSAALVMLLFSIPLFFFSADIISLFQRERAAAEIGAAALRAQALVLTTHGLVTCTILFLQAFGKPVHGTVLAAARQGIFFLPLILWLPRRFGLVGLEWTQPLADLCTALFAIPFVIYAYRLTKRSAAP